MGIRQTRVKVGIAGVSWQDGGDLDSLRLTDTVERTDPAEREIRRVRLSLLHLGKGVGMRFGRIRNA